ncbi:MAG: efflux RND transporter periplasmic adaptor subunit [Treponema sp.]|nr:efflux RND transporter periplasmic adaptor subunit [Treponema sp.]
MPGARGRSGVGGDTVFSVKTKKAEFEVLHDYVATNGEVEAQSSIEVFPDMGGKIRSVNVSLGSPVRKGDVIARVDPSEPGAQYALSPVYAPITGSIVSTPLKEGTTVSTGSAITIIGDIDRLQITANVPERYVALLKTGLTADISLEAYPGIVFKATVSRVSPVVDATSRTKEIILNFDKKDSRINAGMFAKVILYTRDFTDAIVMPSDSLVTKDDKSYAYVVLNDNTVEQREVVLGNSVDGNIQILKGINEGERIVVEGQTSLSNGASIRDITNGVSQLSQADVNTEEKNVAVEKVPALPNEKTKNTNSANSNSNKSGNWGGMSSTGSRNGSSSNK